MLAPDTRTLLASAARTATVSSDWITNPGYKGCVVMLDWTAETDTALLTVSVEGRVGSGTYTVGSGAQKDATGDHALKIYPGLAEFTATGDETAFDYTEFADQVSGILPGEFRVTVTHGDADSATYSVHICLLP